VSRGGEGVIRIQDVGQARIGVGRGSHGTALRRPENGGIGIAAEGTGILERDPPTFRADRSEGTAYRVEKQPPAFGYDRRWQIFKPRLRHEIGKSLCKPRHAGFPPVKVMGVSA